MDPHDLLRELRLRDQLKDAQGIIALQRAALEKAQAALEALGEYSQHEYEALRACEHALTPAQ